MQGPRWEGWADRHRCFAAVLEGVKARWGPRQTREQRLWLSGGHCVAVTSQPPLVFLVAALLRCNSHAIRFTHLKSQFSGFWYIHR